MLVVLDDWCLALIHHFPQEALGPVHRIQRIVCRHHSWKLPGFHREYSDCFQAAPRFHLGRLDSRALA